MPEKTLRTAMDYVALLWGDRVNEKLVKTINPLNEVEVHFDNSAGGFDTVQATWNVTVEREGGQKPCLVAEWLVRYYT